MDASDNPVVVSVSPVTESVASRSKPPLATRLTTFRSTASGAHTAGSESPTEFSATTLTKYASSASRPRIEPPLAVDENVEVDVDVDEKVASVEYCTPYERTSFPPLFSGSVQLTPRMRDDSRATVARRGEGVTGAVVPATLETW